LLEADFPRETTFDLSIVDNAYGMDNDRQDAKLSQLQDTAERVLDAGGHLLLPVPTGGRSQDMLIWTSEQLSNYTIIVERPIWQGLRTMMEHPQWLRAGAQTRIDAVLKVLDVLNSSKVIVPSNDDERMSLLEGDIPCIIFTGDGMMDSPRARWYYDKLSQSSSHANHAVILTGHASRGSFARTILEQDTSLSGCKVQHICYKVHQGLSDVMTMLNSLHSKQTLLVHAPKSETDLVVARLQAEGYDGLHSLQPGMELKLML
jgi:predicted metal-dependent RNase